jgi:hypothetical protein
METTENKYERRHWHGRGKRRIGWIFLGIVGFTAFAFLFGAVVMWLWNWLMPVIFHLGIISYWQAVGLAILGRLLFGSFHHGGPHHGRYHMHGPWKHRFHMGDKRNCGDYSNSEKWSYYEQYWNEEGENAFNEYIKRKNEKEVKQ